MTVGLRADQKARWDKLNELTHTMRNTRPYNPAIIARKATYAANLMTEHFNSFSSKTTAATISVTLHNKKVKELAGFLKMKLNNEMESTHASFVIDHFCEEISYLFLVATQEDTTKLNSGRMAPGYSYVIWRPQANSQIEMDDTVLDWRPPDPQHKLR